MGTNYFDYNRQIITLLIKILFGWQTVILLNGLCHVSQF